MHHIVCTQYVYVCFGHTPKGVDLGPESRDNCVGLNRTSHLLNIERLQIVCFVAQRPYGPLSVELMVVLDRPPLATSITPCSWTSFSGIDRHSYRASIVTFFSGLSCVNRINTLAMGGFGSRWSGNGLNTSFGGVSIPRACVKCISIVTCENGAVREFDGTILDREGKHVLKV